MITLICTVTGKSINLTEQIASSGEGDVWKTNQPNLLAKIYHNIHHTRIKKLQIMIQYPPLDPNANKNHISFAWPYSLLQNIRGEYMGFLMPEIKDSVELMNVYNPKLRKNKQLAINWYFLHTTALNIASIINALHLEGYILGDIKPQNILVNNRALPSFIDTDSFQVRDPKTQKIYPCLVGSPEFTPVELLNKNLANTEQNEFHDRFRLAVIIYYLLFGDHPFKGKWLGKKESPETNELISSGFWPYAPKSLIAPGIMTIPLEIVHPEIQECFFQCFNDGHHNPELRPSPKTWVKALKIALNELTICSQSNSHCYSQTYPECFWCDRYKKLGVDIFAPLSNLTYSIPHQSQIIIVAEYGQYLTIQEAINQATPGSRILVQSGTYQENIMIDKPLQIIGNGQPNTIIIESYQGHSLTISSNSVLLRNLNIRNLANSNNSDFSLYINQGNTIIENCDISSQSYSSVGIEGNKTNVTFNRCKIHDSQISGIEIRESAQVTVEDSQIIANSYCGIEVKSFGNLTLRRCQINQNKFKGIIARSRSKIIVENCDLTHNVRGNWLTEINVNITSKSNIEAIPIDFWSGFRWGVLVFLLSLSILLVL